ncbi:MAG: hypothetical protein KIH69_018410 [Anaerolineae bacterium]|nr:hypothetical protein [Anaerolineae bacterium]
MLCFDLSNTFARIRVQGSNRADFLNRMSTGDLARIKPGEARRTVFITPIGRMIDAVTVVAFADSFLLISSLAHREKLIRWLRKYVFFNDDVRFSDESQSLPHWGMFEVASADEAGSAWPAAAQLLAQPNTPSADAQGAFATAYAPNAWHVIGLADGPVFGALAAYDDMRIRAGWPAAPNEINEDFIPLEANLWDAVSFSKGCYVGQEIIARMEARGQLAKKLMQLHGEPTADASTAAVGDDLLNGNDHVGKITSLSGDGRHALAYVRSVAAIAGQILTTRAGVKFMNA